MQILAEAEDLPKTANIKTQMISLWTVPVFIAGMFVAGFVIELRIYGEVLPIVVAAFWVAFLDVIAETLGDRVGRRASPTA